MKILLSGATGLLGSYIREVLKNEYEIIPLSLSGKKSTIECDLRDEKEVKKIIFQYRPELIIHSAAVTDVKFCEKYPRLAYEVNTLSTRNLAWYGAAINVIFVYISCSSVFNRENRTFYTEEDTPVPTDIYGITKFGGEKYVSYFIRKYFILRTGLLLGKNRHNRIQKIIDKIKNGEKIVITKDNPVSFTFVSDFAQAIKIFLKKIAKEKTEDICCGIYHFVNTGRCSEYQLIKEISENLGRNAKNIIERRQLTLEGESILPLFPVLSPEKTYRITGIILRDWEGALKEYFKN